MSVRCNREPPFFRRREERRRWEQRVTAKPLGLDPLTNKPLELRIAKENALTESGSLDAHEESTHIEGVKDRLAAANMAISSTRTYFFALLSVVVYIGVVVWGTTDEQLLRISPVKLPIVNVEVPLTDFYTAVPLFFVLLHFNLLIHLAFTSKKLRTFLNDLESLDPALASRLRNDVANFPLAQWMAGQHDAVLRTILVMLIWITLVIPPFLLLWMQLRFLSFQNNTFTWVQAAAVIVDALLTIGFQAWFVYHIQRTNRRTKVRGKLWKSRRMSSALRVLLLLIKSLFRYLIPAIPAGLACLLAFDLSNFLEAREISSCEKEPTYLRWICDLYRLDVQERLLTRTAPSPAVANALRNQDAQVRKKALSEILPIDLKGRSLRGANFYASLLPLADLRSAQLQGANLKRAQLLGANLEKALLQNADLSGAQLRDAYLEGTQLSGARLYGAQLQDAYLNEAQLQDTNLRYAQLPNAKLLKAHLQNANLSYATLRDADLTLAQLQHANLSSAKLTGARLTSAQLQDAELNGAHLQDAFLANAQLQDADLRAAQLGVGSGYV